MAAWMLCLTWSATNRRVLRHRACAFALASLTLMGLCGCLPVIYPSIAHVPSLDLDEPVADVHAFRIDASADLINLVNWIPARSFVRRVPVASSGSVGSQTGIYLNYGALQMIIPAASCIRHHTTVVRLYRPGYRLVEIRSWQLATEIRWEPAPDVESQAHALDNLLASPWRPVKPIHAKWDPTDDIYWGSECLEHREAIVFAISEYERLSDLEPGDDEKRSNLRTRLRWRAACLREWADI